ncbi:DNA-binding protein [Mesosutterella sp. OilRF-GAM-744-9]|uniref:DNA-binding protein n=1 Tax=Mesosutterella porci TaxID=2915351 RepID=A0ABS9MMZ8_9BURK|nr:YbaK/EbsC family protein [Mesosutterella sp. oilRF-744-WT-GAM-9]MCG5029995.1 DNA-binding protein [Mesosutterella sp. oilRF-744-WT-GAM-9]
MMSGQLGTPAMDTRANQQAVISFLEQAGIPFERLDYEPIHTAQEGLEIARRLGSFCCKNLLFKNRKGEFFLFMIPGARRFPSGAVARQLGTGHLSFAAPEEIEELLHAFPGSVGPLGLIFDRGPRVRLVIEESILREPFIDCHPCDNGCSLKLSVQDFTGRFLPASGHGFITFRLPEDA